MIAFFGSSKDACRIIYTTNAIESLHSQVRMAIRTKGHFPSDKAATKLFYLVFKSIMAKWKRPPKEWHAAKSQLAIQFGGRITVAAKEEKRSRLIHIIFCTSSRLSEIKDVN